MNAESSHPADEPRRKFVALPYHITEHLHELTRAHHAVLIVLAAGRDFTTDEISQAAGDTAGKALIHPKSLARVLAKLVELNLIEIVSVGVGRGQKPTYRLVYEKVAPVLPIETPKRLRRRSKKVTPTLQKGNNGAPAYKESDSSSDSLSDSPPNAPQGAEGAEGELSRDGEDGQTPLAGFDAFWDAWPKCSKRIDPGRCREVWDALSLNDRADEIVAHVRESAKSQQWRKERGQFMPSPVNYLRKRVYDAPPPALDPLYEILTKREEDEQEAERRAIEIADALDAEAPQDPNTTFLNALLAALSQTDNMLRASPAARPVEAIDVVAEVLAAAGQPDADERVAKAMQARVGWTSHKYAGPPVKALTGKTLKGLIGRGLIRTVDREAAGDVTVYEHCIYHGDQIVFEGSNPEAIRTFVRDTFTPKQQPEAGAA